MNKFETLDSMLQNNNGFLKTLDAVNIGISRAFGEYDSYVTATKKFSSQFNSFGIFPS